MFYTLTANPSLDYSPHITSLRLGAVNRSHSGTFCVGGKGINVSLVLSRLGAQCLSMGFTAGFVGTEIEKQLSQEGLAFDFVHLLQGNSRINIKLIDEHLDKPSFLVTEINATGPSVQPADVQILHEKLKKLKAKDVLVLSGSLPCGLDDSFYADIMARLAPKNVKVAVDATGSLLMQTLPHRPFLIKPNHIELGELFGVQVNTRQEAVAYAKNLCAKGARNVLVSLAEKGAVLVAEDGTVYESDAPKGVCQSAVGAGDSMLAGFLFGFEKTHSLKKALHYGVSAGSATAFLGHIASAQKIYELLGSSDCATERTYSATGVLHSGESVFT